MVDFLYQIDLSVFYFINDSISNKLLDRFFPFITEVDHWYIAYIILIGILFFKGGKLGKISALGAIILIAISDQLSSSVFKFWFARTRPCIELFPNVNILTGCTDSFSFPSSHAVNNFAVAAFFTKLYPNLKWVLFIVASLIAISRVYVGRHYPSDVVGGAIIGAAIGYVLSIGVLELNKFLDQRNKKVINA